MRKIIFDFYFTALVPFSVVAIVCMCRSAYISIKESLGLYRLKTVWANSPGDYNREACAELRQETEKTIREERQKALLWAGIMALFCGFTFLNNTMKLSLIQPFWIVFGYLSLALFIGGVGASCYYAFKREWKKFVLAAVIMLLASACTEHFLHLRFDTEHALCPHCDDSDDDN